MKGQYFRQKLNIFVLTELKEDIDHAFALEFGDDEFTEDPEDVVEEMITSEVENFHKQDLQAGETMKIVENSAIKVLATRLPPSLLLLHNFGLSVILH